MLRILTSGRLAALASYRRAPMRIANARVVPFACRIAATPGALVTSLGSHLRARARTVPVRELGHCWSWCSRLDPARDHPVGAHGEELLVHVVLAWFGDREVPVDARRRASERFDAAVSSLTEHTLCVKISVVPTGG
jgi:hypothetical protein